MICWTFSKVTISPRDGSSSTPPRTGVFLDVPDPKAFLAKSERTCPAVRPSRLANSLAACKTSSSISNVVLTHLMISHQMMAVKLCHPTVPRPSKPRHFVPLAHFSESFVKSQFTTHKPLNDLLP